MTSPYDAIVKKAIAQIDIEDIIKEITPQVRAEIKEAILDAVRSIEWYERVDEALSDVAVTDALIDVILDALGKKRNVKKKKR